MKLFVFAVGAHDRASSRLRIWDHVGWLRERGHAVTAESLMAPCVTGATAGFFGRFLARYPRWILQFLRADAALIQESMALWPAVLLKNLGRRRRLVFDFSDPVDRVGRGASRRIRRRLFRLFASRANAVIVENKLYLEHFAENGTRALHFYGPVDVARYQSSRERLRPECERRERLRIGWTGSPGTFRFIEPLLPAIDALARERPIELLLIGVKSIDFAFSHAQLRLEEWSEEKEFDLVPTFDLGLFRLDGTEDSLWRGAGKLFIYMAAGVPFVATDAGIAQAIMRESGLGFPVARDEQWREVLASAAADAEARRSFAERSLSFARDNLSYELYREQLSRLLNEDGRGPGKS